MPIPGYQDFYPIILKNADTPKTADEYLEVIAPQMNITELELAERYPSGEGIVRNRLRWSMHYLLRANLVSKAGRGIFVITDRGREFFKNHSTSITNKDLSQFEEFNSFRALKERQPKNSIEDIIATEVSILAPMERLEVASAELNRELQQELIGRILEQSPAFFERLVITLLSKMGYGSEGALAKAIGKSGDMGIDGIIHQDKLGLDAVYIQAKRYDPDNGISSPQLQAFVGSLAGFQSTKGVFVTTSYFTKPALDYLKTIQTRIVPIDGVKLVELMIEHEVGSRTAQTFKVNKVDEDFFID